MIVALGFGDGDCALFHVFGHGCLDQVASIIRHAQGVVYVSVRLVSDARCEWSGRIVVPARRAA